MNEQYKIAEALRMLEQMKKRVRGFPTKELRRCALPHGIDKTNQTSLRRIMIRSWISKSF